MPRRPSLRPFTAPLVAALAVLVAGCAARPLPVTSEAWVVREVSDRWDEFFHQPGDAREPVGAALDLAILRPRFGAPAIADLDGALSLELLARSGDRAGAAPNSVDGLRAALALPAVTDGEAERCLEGIEVAGCRPLAIAGPVAADAAVEHGVLFARRHVSLAPSSQGPPVAGGYDLLVEAPGSRLRRQRRAVWLHAGASRPGPLRVVQLSDLHIGKGEAGDIEGHLQIVLADVNADDPDLVLVTGDLTNWGTNAALPPRARAFLETIEAPVLVVMGNHDIGFGQDALHGGPYGAGWSNFARSFHPLLHYRVDLAGWRFIGFDSGPSTPSPQVLTRGLDDEDVRRLAEEIDEAAREHLQGVVLFSHAATRADLSEHSAATDRGLFGRMRDGGLRLEQAMLAGARAGLRVFHMNGHSHWSDVFEARPGATDDALDFARWPDARLHGCLEPLRSRVVLVTTQAATHPGVLRNSGHGYGYALLLLDDKDPRLAFHRYGIPAISCQPARP